MYHPSKWTAENNRDVVYIWLQLQSWALQKPISPKTITKSEYKYLDIFSDWQTFNSKKTPFLVLFSQSNIESINYLVIFLLLHLPTELFPFSHLSKQDGPAGSVAEKWQHKNFGRAHVHKGRPSSVSLSSYLREITWLGCDLPHHVILE